MKAIKAFSNSRVRNVMIVCLRKSLFARSPGDPKMAAQRVCRVVLGVFQLLFHPRQGSLTLLQAFLCPLDADSATLACGVLTASAFLPTRLWAAPNALSSCSFRVADGGLCP